MKKAIIILSLSLLSYTGYSQNVKVNAYGNYVAIKSVNQVKAKETGKFYLDTAGIKHPVFLSEKGKLFVKRVSVKTGKTYNYYLKVD